MFAIKTTYMPESDNQFVVNQIYCVSVPFRFWLFARFQAIISTRFHICFIFDHILSVCLSTSQSFTLTVAPLSAGAYTASSRKVMLYNFLTIVSFASFFFSLDEAICD